MTLESRLFSSWQAACVAAEESYSSGLVNEFRVNRWRYNSQQRHSPNVDVGALALIAALCGPNTRVIQISEAQLAITCGPFELGPFAYLHGSGKRDTCFVDGTISTSDTLYHSLP